MFAQQIYDDNADRHPAQSKSFVQALISEVDFYKKTQAVLQSEINELLADNKDLSQRLRSCLKSHSREPVEGYDGLVKELHHEVAQLTKEKESFVELWKTSKKTIESLETELQTYQSKYFKNNEELRGFSDNDIIEELNIKLTEALNHESGLENEFRDTKIENVNNIKKLAQTNNIIVGLEKRQNEYVSQVEELILETKKLKHNNDQLLAEIENIKSKFEQCLVKETEAKKKVEEAIAERDNALKRALCAEEQSALVKSQIVGINEVNEKSQYELDEVKRNCDEKISDMLAHVQQLDHQGTENALALAKTIRECKILRAENERYAKVQSESKVGVQQELLLMEQRLEQLHKKLICSERKNLRLTSEKHCLNVEVQQIRLSHQREIKKRNFEEKILHNEVDDLRKKCEYLQNTLEECHVRLQALQCEVSTKTELSEKLIVEKEDAVRELNKHVEQQMNLNKQWKKCYSQVTQKLETSLLQLQEENAQLRVAFKTIRLDMRNNL